MTMPIQRPNRCVTSIMVLVNRIFGGNIEEKEYLKDYRLKYRKNIRWNGVRLSNLEAFVNAHFNTTTNVTTFKDIIDKGYVALMGLQDPLDSLNGHNILYVGYNSDGTAIVMDPAIGKQGPLPSNLSLLYVIVITGNK